jgi:acetolactate synthase-1/2/3 large subunit
MIKVSDLIFDFIASKGVDTVFTISGGGCMHLTDSLSKNTKLKYVCNHHEQACAMAAEGYARTSNKPGCILVTTGPGGTNAITGVLCAYQDSVPLIIISGQVPTEQLSIGTGCRQIGQQEADLITVVKPITKYAKTITDKNDILYSLQKAYSFATSNRPGPVWLEIPLDIQNSFVNAQELKKYKKYNFEKINFLKDTFYLKKFLKCLEKSKKPVIVVGNGIRASDTVQELKDLLNITKIPVMSGPHSAVDVINDDYPYYAGRFGLLGQYTSNQIIQESDLVISLGSRLNPKMIGYNSKLFAPNAVKFVIDVDKSEIKKLSFNQKIGWCINLKTFFKLIKNKNIQINSDIKKWHQYIKTYRKKENLVLPKHYTLKKYVSTYVFAQKLEKHLTPNSIIVTSDGTAHVVPLKTMSLTKEQRLFSNEGTAPMGYGLPAAIGAYYGSKQSVICIEGDGSIMMNLQELETVQYNKIPLTIFIINNDGYVSIRLTQQSFFKGNLAASDKTCGVSIPSFKKIAQAFNFNYSYIKNNKQIDNVLSTINFNVSNIIEVFTDPNEQHEPKVVAKGFDKNGKIIPGELTNMNLCSITN